MADEEIIARKRKRSSNSNGEERDEEEEDDGEVVGPLPTVEEFPDSKKTKRTHNQTDHMFVTIFYYTTQVYPTSGCI